MIWLMQFRADTLIDSQFSPKSNGGLLKKEELEAIAELANKHDFYILSDEIYSRILYEGNHESIIRFPGMQERTIYSMVIQKLIR
jgi:aspartate/methionine/tyrosine aminotransferase